MEDCLFCGIASGDVPGDIVYRDESVLAFRDIAPEAPVHLLIIPRRHVAGVDALRAEDEATLGHAMQVAGQLAATHGVAASGFRVVVNTGPDAGQSVHHLHLHLLGGRALGWPPG